MFTTTRRFKALAVAALFALLGAFSAQGVAAAPVIPLCTTTTTASQVSVNWPNATDCPLAGATFSGANCGSGNPTFMIVGSNLLSTGSGSNRSLLVRFNGDSGNNYNYSVWAGLAYAGFTQTNDFAVRNAASGTMAILPGTGSTIPGDFIVQMPLAGYAGTDFSWGSTSFDDTAALEQVSIIMGRWHNPVPANAVQTMSMFWDSGNFAAGGKLVLNCD